MVRKVWQIAAGKVRIGGKSWQANLDSILARVSRGLGCGEAIAAELYKLLVYDRDGLFLLHRDTEKSPGMFGTLVLTLSSVHRGGDCESGMTVARNDKAPCRKARGFSI